MAAPAITDDLHKRQPTEKDATEVALQYARDGATLLCRGTYSDADGIRFEPLECHEDTPNGHCSDVMRFTAVGTQVNKETGVVDLIGTVAWGGEPVVEYMGYHNRLKREHTHRLAFDPEQRFTLRWENKTCSWSHRIVSTADAACPLNQLVRYWFYRSQTKPDATLDFTVPIGHVLAIRDHVLTEDGFVSSHKPARSPWYFSRWGNVGRHAEVYSQIHGPMHCQYLSLDQLSGQEKENLLRVENVMPSNRATVLVTVRATQTGKLLGWLDICPKKDAFNLRMNGVKHEEADVILDAHHPYAFSVPDSVRKQLLTKLIRCAQFHTTKPLLVYQLMDTHWHNDPVAAKQVPAQLLSEGFIRRPHCRHRGSSEADDTVTDCIWHNPKAAQKSDTAVWDLMVITNGHSSRLEMMKTNE